MSYKDLLVWQKAREVVIAVHSMSLKLPSFEAFEEGSQIRRSSKTVRSSIVEGFGRRRYKQDWIKFLVYAISSNDETADHLETLWETGSLKDEVVYRKLQGDIDLLGKLLNRFISAVEIQHRTSK